MWCRDLQLKVEVTDFSKINVSICSKKKSTKMRRMRYLPHCMRKPIYMQDTMTKPLPTQQISDSGDANPGAHLCKLSEKSDDNEFAPLLSAFLSSCWVHLMAWVHICSPYEVANNLIRICSLYVKMNCIPWTLLISGCYKCLHVLGTWVAFANKAHSFSACLEQGHQPGLSASILLWCS